MEVSRELRPMHENPNAGEAALVMAIGIVSDRISRLSEADRQDLFELVKGLGSATSKEDMEAVRSGMLEILEQGVPSVDILDQPAVAEPSAKIAKWKRHVAERVRALREQKGMTQAQIAAKSGLTQSHVSRIENSEIAPSHRTIERLAGALGVEPSEIDPTR
jgi:DNA-binding XRE family transcriptional regulator